MFSSRTFVAAVALATAGLAASAAQAGVVIASSGPSAGQFPKGKKLADTDRITLRDGDSVTILDAGGTRVLKGAGTYRVGARSTEKRSTFAVLTRQRAAQRVRTGAVRAGDAAGPVLSPNLWYVDVSKSGKFCVADAAGVQLWRPETEGGATYRIAGPGSQASTQISFDDGATTAPWASEQMPLTEGASYTLAGPAGRPQGTFTFTLLDKVPDDPEGLATALMEKGCDAQLDLLATAMMTS